MARRKRRGVSSIIGTIFFILIVFVAFTVFTLLFQSFASYTNLVSSTNHHALLNQETSISMSSFTFGTQAPSTAGTATSSIPPAIPITLTNSQTSPTPNPFQQEITWNPSTYNTNEATNLGNIRFCVDSACNTELYSWLQSCTPSCSNTATSAVAWVRLTSSIPASGGTLTIYMVLLSVSTNFDGVFWGEAPTISATYGQYDNGANVFTLYDNFAGTALSATWSVTNHFGSYAVNNGLTLTTTRTTGYAFVYSTTQAQPQVAEAYMGSVSGDSPNLGVETSSSYNGYGMYNGYSLNWFGTTDSFCPETSAGTGTCATRTVSTFPAGIWSVYWAAVGNEGATDGSGNTITSTNNGVGAIANYGIALGATPDGTGSNLVQWARMRAFPPNNVMPGVSFGSFVPSSSSSTSYSFDRKVVYSQGLWWAFFSDGTNIGLVTSPDGSVWSSETTVSTSTGATNGYDFSVWQSGTTIYYVLAGSGASNSFLWRYGTMQSSGSISWSIPETSVTTTNTAYSYNSIVTDSSGNVWVALNTHGGTNTHIEVWRYSTGVWAKVDDISPVPTDTVPILVPISSGVALVYGSGGTTQTVSVTATTTGSSWSAVVSPPSYYKIFSSSATSMGNTLYFVGLASSGTGATSGTINFWSFNFGATQTSSETQLQATSSSWDTTMSEETSRTLIVFYGSGSSVYDTYSVNGGASWYPSATISGSESSIAGLTSTFDGTGAIWTSGTTSPFNIRFANLPSVTITNNSPFPVHLISLYIYNPSTNALIHFDTNSSATGVSGLFDYWLGAGEIVSVPLPPFIWVTSQNYQITATTDQGLIYGSSTYTPS